MNTIKYFFIPVLLLTFLSQSFSQINPLITDATSTNAHDGSIILSVQGGLPPYSYAWDLSSGSSGTPGNHDSNELLNLSVGEYCVTVTDASGCCSISQCFTVGSKCPHLITGLKYSFICSGEDGSLQVVLAEDGTPPYKYQWSNGEETQSISGLKKGTYCVTVSDQSECTVSMCFVMQDRIFSSGTVTNACAGTSNGAIDLSVSVATAPFTYAWSNGCQVLYIHHYGLYC